MAINVRIGLFQCVDEAERRRTGSLGQIVGDGCVHIPVDLPTRDDDLGFQLRARVLDPLRIRSRTYSLLVP